MLLEQGTALTLRHTAPNSELHTIVQRVGTTLGDDWAMPADDRGFALGGTPHEELIGVLATAARLGNPSDSGFGLRSMGRNLDRCCACSAHCGPNT
jgi:hypothetical protein